MRAKEDRMPEIKGVVIEVKCEPCDGTGIARGGLVAFVACHHCKGEGVQRPCLAVAELKKLLADS